MTETTTQSEYLSAADILNITDEEVRELEIPEWGGRKIRVKTISAGESAEFTALAEDRTKKGEAPLHLLVMSLVDESGNRMFTKQDVQKLKARSLKVVLRIQDVAMELNGLTDKAKEAAKNA